MTPVDVPAQNRLATEIAVGGLRVWYHLPFGIAPGHRVDLSAEGWQEMPCRGTLQQSFYFHDFVSNALWEGRGGAQGALFDRFIRPTPAEGERPPFEAFFEQPERPPEPRTHADGTTTASKPPLVKRQGFKGQLRSVELRRLRPRPTETGHAPEVDGLGMLVVCVDWQSTSYNAFPADCPDLPRDFCPMTLADAQDVLDLSRRIFPRWHSDLNRDLPGDAFSIVGDARAPTEQDMDTAASEGKTRLMPWVARLAAPYRLDGTNSYHFGDERSFVTSAVLLGEGNESWDPAFALSCAVQESDLLRLAELDRHGTGYNYNKPFLRSLLPGYLYPRQAPDAESGTGNTTHIITSSHHLCVMGTGGFFKTVILGNGRPGDHDMGHVEEYYRHMQFLCAFEYFRLIQFSMALTALVRDQRAAAADPARHRDRAHAFGRRLMRIRSEFLDFTHLHHFSNISSQLQPREMFDRLYAAFGIPAMFAEVEKELEAATSFHEMQTNAEAREDGARLNKLVSVGVPLSLLVGAGGMNIFIGTNAPFGLHKIAPPGDGPDGWLQLLQLGVLVAIIAGVWALAEWVYFHNKRSFWGWLAFGAAAAAFAGSEALHLWPAP